MKMQRYERNRFPHLPVHCGFCGQLVISASENEPLINPCAHTVFIAHDEGYEFLAERAILQLRKKGFTVSTETGKPIEGIRPVNPYGRQPRTCAGKLEGDSWVEGQQVAGDTCPAFQ